MYIVDGERAAYSGPLLMSGAHAPCNGQDADSSPIEISMLYADVQNPSDMYWPNRAAAYQRAFPWISISLERVEGGLGAFERRVLDEARRGESSWDVVSIPAQITGDLVRLGALWDLSSFVRESSALEWENIFSFYREEVPVYDNKVRLIPLDGDLHLLFYREDLFEEFNVQVPRTWDEYTEAAKFFHGKPLGPDNTTIFGSCISRIDNCANAYWTSLILSSMTQANGTSSGFMFDPMDMKPLLGEAMDETLRFLDEQSKYGHESEFEGPCLGINAEINNGRCAMVYNWGNLLNDPDVEYLPYGITRTPGSTRVLDRETGRLVNCTMNTCPYEINDEDLGFINSPSYAAFGGWAGGVSAFTTDEKQRAAAEFLAWVSNSSQSLYDVIPNDNRTASFAQPYRRSHSQLSYWTDGPGRFDETTSMRYTEAVELVNGLNTAVELRIPSSESFRQVLNQEVYQFLTDIHQHENLTGNEDTRQAITKRINQKFQDVITMHDLENPDMPLIDSYQQSLGVFLLPPQDNNFIGNAARFSGWVLAGLVCIMAVSWFVWVFFNRKSHVVESSQPPLLLQMSVGVFFIGLAMVPLGIDDELLDEGDKLLDTACMAIPWLYVMGFSTLISPIMSKLRIYYSVFYYPENHESLRVSWRRWLLTSCLIFIPNITLLVAWTIIDPLFWKREDKENDHSATAGYLPDTFGRCTSNSSAFPIYAILLSCFNLVVCIIGILFAARCQMKVEFNELKWLSIAILPFIELWVVCGIAIFLTLEEPIELHTLLGLIMCVSAITSTLAIFGPKLRYLKKERRRNNEEREARLAAAESQPVGEDVSDSTMPSRISGPQMIRHPQVSL